MYVYIRGASTVPTCSAGIWYDKDRSRRAGSTTAPTPTTTTNNNDTDHNNDDGNNDERSPL